MMMVGLLSEAWTNDNTCFTRESVGKSCLSFVFSSLSPALILAKFFFYVSLHEPVNPLHLYSLTRFSAVTIPPLIS